MVRPRAVTEYLGREAYAIGLNSSAPMLDRARERLDGDPRVELREHDLRQALPLTGAADAVVSGLAIHHLEDDRKRGLFAKIHDLLAPGSVFANLDLVRSASAHLHERFRCEIGRVEDDPTDRLADLAEQMSWLRAAGFAEVDCHFKAIDSGANESSSWKSARSACIAWNAELVSGGTTSRITVAS